MHVSSLREDYREKLCTFQSIEKVICYALLPAQICHIFKIAICFYNVADDVYNYES